MATEPVAETATTTATAQVLGTPEVEDGGLLVLNQCFSPDVAPFYKACQAAYAEETQDTFAKNKRGHNKEKLKLRIKDILEIEEGGIDQAYSHLKDKCIGAVKNKLVEHISVHCVTAQEILDDLPQLLPCNPLFETYTVGPPDPRTGLHGGEGVRVAQTDGVRVVKAGTLVGPYQGHLLHNIEFEMWKLEKKGGLTYYESHLMHDSYAVDIATCSPHALHLRYNLPSPQTAKKEEINSFVVSGFNAANMTARVNDPRFDPINNWAKALTAEEAAGINCIIVEMKVGAWSFPFMFTCKDILPGQDLRYDYGTQYWYTFHGHDVEIKSAWLDKEAIEKQVEELTAQVRLLEQQLQQQATGSVAAAGSAGIGGGVAGSGTELHNNINGNVLVGAASSRGGAPSVAEGEADAPAQPSIQQQQQQQQTQPDASTADNTQDEEGFPSVSHSHFASQGGETPNSNQQVVTTMAALRRAIAAPSSLTLTIEQESYLLGRLRLAVQGALVISPGATYPVPSNFRNLRSALKAYTTVDTHLSRDMKTCEYLKYFPQLLHEFCDVSLPTNDENVASLSVIRKRIEDFPKNLQKINSAKREAFKAAVHPYILYRHAKPENGVYSMLPPPPPPQQQQQPQAAPPPATATALHPPALIPLAAQSLQPFPLNCNITIPVPAAPPSPGKPLSPGIRYIQRSRKVAGAHNSVFPNSPSPPPVAVLPTAVETDTTAPDGTAARVDQVNGGGKDKQPLCREDTAMAEVEVKQELDVEEEAQQVETVNGSHIPMAELENRTADNPPQQQQEQQQYDQVDDNTEDRAGPSCLPEFDSENQQLLETKGEAPITDANDPTAGVNRTGTGEYSELLGLDTEINEAEEARMAVAAVAGQPLPCWCVEAIWAHPYVEGDDDAMLIESYSLEELQKLLDDEDICTAHVTFPDPCPADLPFVLHKCRVGDILQAWQDEVAKRQHAKEALIAAEKKVSDLKTARQKLAKALEQVRSLGTQPCTKPTQHVDTFSLHIAFHDGSGDASGSAPAILPLQSNGKLKRRVEDGMHTIKKEPRLAKRRSKHYSKAPPAPPPLPPPSANGNPPEEDIIDLTSE